MNDYTMILFYRKDLFGVARIGFIASKIGDLWCEGWVLNDRLSKLTNSNVWFEVLKC